MLKSQEENEKNYEPENFSLCDNGFLPILYLLNNLVHWSVSFGAIEQGRSVVGYQVSSERACILPEEYGLPSDLRTQVCGDQNRIIHTALKVDIIEKINATFEE